MTEQSGPYSRVRTRIRDGEAQWQLRCPGCEQWADIDDDQIHGRTSVDHSAGSDDQGFASDGGCGYHETRDWFTEEGLEPVLRVEGP